ncbi:glycine/D-amino acid oxidase, deaminating [gamma proteobacterium HIMB55]|nr:glycine/D-amino acid oxidase, deaminating [gamma proteobacterium HIMB55]
MTLITPEYPNSWYHTSAELLPEQSSLQGDVLADVCVIGAGYTGLSAALHLAKAGKQVVILEAARIGWGASGRNGGHVGTGQRADQFALEKWYGKDRAKELWRLGLDAVGLVESLVKEHSIDCELGKGNIHYAAKPAHTDELREEIEHLETAYDYHHLRGVEKADLGSLGSAQGFHYAMIDEGARHLHPLKYCLGLARAALAAGVMIYEQSRATGLQVQGDGAVIQTSSGSIRADRVVLACNGYLEKLYSPIASNIMPINNFIVATEPLTEEIAQQINPLNASLSDSLFVINYWKLSEDRRLIFGGGETYSDKFPSSITDFVRPHLLGVYPELADTRLDFGWGGTLAITRNRMPDMGIKQGVLYYAQGFSGHGVPTATMAGKLMALSILDSCEDFDLMAGLETISFPGGPLLRRPSLIAGMLFYSLLDRLGR